MIETGKDGRTIELKLEGEESQEEVQVAVMPKDING